MFWGESVQAVLDRFPTAVIVGKEEEKTIIEADVFGRGIKMWLLSQAELLEVLEPESFRNEMKETLTRMLQNYSKPL